MDAVPLFLMTSLALVGSPGPNTLSLAALGAAFGARSGVAYMLGLNLGMVGVLVLVGSGFSAILMSFPGVAPVVAFAATAYLLYLACRIATASPVGAATAAPDSAPRWYAGVALSLTNPKAYVAVAAVFSRYSLLPDTPLADQFAKGGLMLATIIPVNVLWLGVGAVLARSVANPVVGRAVNICFACLLVLSVAVAAFW